MWTVVVLLVEPLQFLLSKTEGLFGPPAKDNRWHLVKLEAGHFGPHSPTIILNLYLQVENLSLVSSSLTMSSSYNTNGNRSEIHRGSYRGPHSAYLLCTIARGKL